MKLEDIISKEAVNKGRQNELDIAKAFLIFSLAVVHTFCECSTPEALWKGMPYFFDSVIGGPWGAPVFMFCMGIGLAYSRHNNPSDLAKRGLKIGLMGIGLNICRYLIPSLVGYLFTGDKEFYIDRLPDRFFGNDILQFACLAMLLMALLTYLHLKPVHIWIVSFVLSIISNFITGRDFGNHVINIIMGHLIGTEDARYTVFSDFPLIIWFFMYTTGYMFALLLKRIKAKKLIYGLIIPILGIPVILIFRYQYYNGIGMMGGPRDNVFYHMRTYEMLLCIMAALVMFAVSYFIGLVLPDKIMQVITNISKNITEVYVVQWTIVWWFANVFLMIIRKSKYMESVPTLIAGIIISIISIIIADLWKKSKAVK